MFVRFLPTWLTLLWQSCLEQLCRTLCSLLAMVSAAAVRQYAKNVWFDLFRQPCSVVPTTTTRLDCCGGGASCMDGLLCRQQQSQNLSKCCRLCRRRCLLKSSTACIASLRLTKTSWGCFISSSTLEPSWTQPPNVRPTSKSSPT